MHTTRTCVKLNCPTLTHQMKRARVSGVFQLTARPRALAARLCYYFHGHYCGEFYGQVLGRPYAWPTTRFAMYVGEKIIVRIFATLESISDYNECHLKVRDAKEFPAHCIDSAITYIIYSLDNGHIAFDSTKTASYKHYNKFIPKTVYRARRRLLVAVYCAVASAHSLPREVCTLIVAHFIFSRSYLRCRRLCLCCLTRNPNPRARRRASCFLYCG